MRRVTALATGIAGVIAIGGCSTSPQEPASPRQKLTAAAEEKCGAIKSRFTGDLSFGDSLGSGGVPRLRQRIDLITDLRGSVQGMPAPESGQLELNAWDTALGKFVHEMRELEDQLVKARMGSDMLIALQVNIVDDAATEAGEAARRFGLTVCADVGSWKIFGGK